MTNHCPICQGTGKKSMSISTYGSKEPPKVIVIDCVICKGGQSPLTESMAASYKRGMDAQDKLWCKCENAGADVTYVPDGASKKCSKHHWIHNACGKIVQVG
jgi:hypothetical protein